MATIDYSPIRSLRIRNFRQLGNVDLQFDTPIVTVVGENDAGKTSVMLALGVVGLNAHSSKQRKYIKRGTSAFGLSLNLADGTEVRRIKASNQNSLQIYRGEEVILDLMKFDNPSLQPVELEKVMGLLKDSSTGEILNIRTYNDRLIFAQTTSGDNYKIIYELLKVSNLVRAIKKGNEEAGYLKKQINNNAILIEHTLNSLREIKQVNIEPLLITRKNLGNIMGIFDKADKAMEKKAIVDRYNTDTLISIQSLNAVDTGIIQRALRAIEYNKYIKNIEQMHCIGLIDSVENVDTDLINKVSRAINTKKKIDSIQVKSADDLESLKGIDTGILVKLENAIHKKEMIANTKSVEVNAESIDLAVITGLSRAMNIMAEIADKDRKADSINAEIAEIKEALKESGAKYKICPNCGEVVIIDE